MRIITGQSAKLVLLLAIAALAPSVLGCAPGLNDSNGVKMGEALAFMAAAGAAQVAQSAAEQRARNQAAIHASGLAVTPSCGDQAQYPCVSVSSTDPERPPEPEMSVDEAHDYILGYVNGVRKLNGIAPVVRDPSLDAFAAAGSDALSLDHRLGQHLADHAAELHAIGAEIQGSPEGSPPGPLQDRLAEIMLHAMDEGPGGMHHDILLRREWRKLGVGIVSRDGRMYLTVDFTD
jgi:hypothetical protein